MKSKILNVLIYFLMALVSLFALAVNVVGLFQDGERLPIGNAIAFIVIFTFVSIVSIRHLIRGIIRLKTDQEIKKE
jgi:predicted Co/Zn/Cd cation transporter (cation efflux family)